MPQLTIIDGHSGVGKTSYAAILGERFGAQIMHLDALYPGWDGLARGARSVAEALRLGSYRRYDWERGDFAERVDIDPHLPLIIEGCGALTRQNLAAAREWVGPESSVHSIWVACRATLRKRRALARDGEMFRPHWNDWARQEREFFARQRPLSLAAEIVHLD